MWIFVTVVSNRIKQIHHLHQQYLTDSKRLLKRQLVNKSLKMTIMIIKRARRITDIVMEIKITDIVMGINQKTKAMEIKITDIVMVINQKTKDMDTATMVDMDTVMESQKPQTLQLKPPILSLKLVLLLNALIKINHKEQVLLLNNVKINQILKVLPLNQALVTTEVLLHHLNNETQTIRLQQETLKVLLLPLNLEISLVLHVVHLFLQVLNSVLPVELHK
jgi:hypothetical protein